MQETRVQSLGGDDPLEEGMAIHSSILAWKIPWTEESGGQLEKNHVVPTAWQDEALARDGVSREVPCSALNAPPRHAHGDLTSLAPHERLPEILVVPRVNLSQHQGLF